MQIDPTKWPKVEVRVAVAGKYWSVCKTSGDVMLTLVNQPGRIANPDREFYGPVDFAAPKVAPSKPQFTLLRRTKGPEGDAADAEIGDMAWGHKLDGDYFIVDAGQFGWRWAFDCCVEIKPTI